MEIDPSQVTDHAMAEYDKNHDGFLDAKELERCPGLKRALKRLDQNHDGKLSRDELEKRFNEYATSHVGLMEVMLRFTLDDKPLAGATIQMEPESFMGSTIKPATGETNDLGKARMQLEGAKNPGCHFGVFRLRVSKKNGAGTEMLPARFNTQTTLGIEVGPAIHGSSETVFALKSR